MELTLEINKTLSVIENYKTAKNITLKFFGWVGFILLLPFVIVFELISFTVLSYLNREIKKDKEELLATWLHKDEKEQANIHLIIEKFVIKLKNSYNPSEHFFILFPLDKPLKNIISTLFAVESEMKKHLYPNLNIPPSNKQINRLLNAFQGKNDWNSEDLDIYENYLK